jgi:hypothetical protein
LQNATALLFFAEINMILAPTGGGSLISAFSFFEKRPKKPR